MGTTTNGLRYPDGTAPLKQGHLQIKNLAQDVDAALVSLELTPGPKGDKGDTGATGPAGADGPTGPQGGVGPAGPKGDTGATGAAGPKGDTGATGPEGPAGPKGDTGAAGAAGAKGDTGATGAKGDTGTAGAAGPAGADGKTILSTTGAPAAGLGTNGDYALDVAAGNLYGPKASGTWPAARSIVGPQGPTGAAGSGGTGTRIRNLYSNSFTRIGTGGAFGWAENRIYLVNLGSPVANIGSSGIVMTANKRYAVPFYLSRAATIAEFVMLQNATGTGNLKLSVYTNKSDTQIYPDQLVWESSVIAATTVGTIGITANLGLSADSLYWVDAVISASTQFAAAPSNACWPILGHTRTIESTAGYTPGIGFIGTATTGNTYSATSPTTYPTTSDILASNTPAVFARYSA